MKTLPFRHWFYFRTGYGRYFAFLLGIGNMATLTYYLAIENSPALGTVFSSFTAYVAAVAVMAIPLFSLAGFLHMRKVPAYKSEAEVGAEAQPYHYKLTPGIAKECTAPLLLEMLVMLRKSASGEKLGKDDVARLQNLEKKFDVLVGGGSLPRPKKFDIIE